MKNLLSRYGKYFWLLPFTLSLISWYSLFFGNEDIFDTLLFSAFTYYFYLRGTGKLTDDNEIGVIPLGENLQTLYETLNYFCNTISENELIAYNKVIGKWVEQYYSPQNIVKFFKTILK